MSVICGSNGGCPRLQACEEAGACLRPAPLSTDLRLSPCKLYPGEWLVEETGTDGEVYMARFSGPNADMRANAYIGLRIFATDVSGQKPQKPDYWSECSQCERNINEAQELVEAHRHV